MAPGSWRRIWYAAYGSNLHWPRFRRYLEGGRAAGAGRVHAPAADRRPPRATATATLPFPLLFAGASPTWGGGVAFLDPTRRDALTLARLYLLSAGQFAAVVAGEGNRPSARLPGRGVATLPWYVLAPGGYGTLVFCGQREGLPVLSVTGPPAGARVAAPRPSYLRTVAAGLVETHRLSASAVADYLRPVPGVAGHYEHAELVALASSV